MLTDPTSRRAFLAAAGSALGAAWLAADPKDVRASLDHATRAARASPPPDLEVLTPEQAADLDAIAAQIIPSGDSPGAHEAGAVHFIDHSLATWGQDQRESVTRGLDDLNHRVGERWPGAGRFAGLVAERQLELLHAVEGTPFFGQVRFAVIAGTFANPAWGGNQNGVGYAILGFEPRFAWQPPFGEYDADEMRR